MNLRNVVRHLGLMLGVLSGAVLVIAGLSWLIWRGMGPSDRVGALGMALTGAAGLLAGATCLLASWRCDHYFGRREALLMVALGWLVGAALAAMPYYLWAHFQSLPDHPFRSYPACYFEAMSGLTTTGASVLSDIESLPRDLLLWRATTQWLGGVGIVVLFVAVLPNLGVGGKKLLQFETPGPSKAGVRPRIRETARILWFIYLLLTLTQTLALRLCGMDWFDAVCHTFATLATGGFSTRNASLGAYDSTAIDVVTIVFMILAGTNFGLFYFVLKGQYRRALTDPELRWYLTILATATVVVTAILAGETLLHMTGRDAVGIGETVRHAAFQVVSIQTTTGFCTADFNRWPFAVNFILVALMFIGGCSGSTGGGIKVIRCLIAGKILLVEVQRVFQPDVVRPVRIGRATVDPALRQSVIVYVLSIVLLFVFGAGLIAAIEGHPGVSFTTAATAVAATLNNIGPGLARVGATQNYGWFSAPSHLILALLMALGRLEIYAIAVLFVPSFWRRS